MELFDPTKEQHFELEFNFLGGGKSTIEHTKKFPFPI